MAGVELVLEPSGLDAYQRGMRLLIVRLSFLLVFLLGLLPSVRSAAPQGAELMKTDLLGVFAHPDDETGVAATTARYALGEKRTVAHVYCTRGEGGGNMVGTQSGPALGVLREAELRDCLRTLGVRYCYFLDRHDFAYTESLLATLERWGHEAILGDLVRLVRSLRPEVIITMDPAPTPGQHGNHQAAGLLATEAFDAAADPARFPEQLSAEGLHPWQVRKLYYSGWDDRLQTTITVTNAIEGVGFPWQVAAEALSNHRSQAFGQFAMNPRFRRAQMFRLVKSVVPGEVETDLFRGLPLSANIRPTPVRLAAESPTGLRIAFQSRPAISNYNRWVKAQRLDGIARAIPADLSVVAGQPNMVTLSLDNDTRETLRGALRLSVPTGWSVEPSTLAYELNPGQGKVQRLKLVPAAAALGAAMLEARMDGAATTNAVARLSLNAVPLMRAVRLSSPPSVDGSERGWEGVAFQEIPSTRVWQGQARDAADVSGRFRVAVSGRTLYLDVQVRDDVVVTNIAPDDIKGHWRSDSIEICLDPQAGAENALGAYKLGVFPFDTTGVVKGARDADARPGPIAQSAPGTRLASFRTADGYRILASIPMAEAGLSRGRRIGFNLLIYDGDKAGAALGENINKTRLAWAARPGVQGRPEDWGRLDLD